MPPTDLAGAAERRPPDLSIPVAPAVARLAGEAHGAVPDAAHGAPVGKGEGRGDLGLGGRRWRPRSRRGGCDPWIWVRLIPDDTPIIRGLARVERLVVAAPGPLAEHEGAPIEARPWLSLGPFEGERIELAAARGARRALTVRSRLATDDAPAPRQAAPGGLGTAILPRWLVADALRRGALVAAAQDRRAPTPPVDLALAAGEAWPLRVERPARRGERGRGEGAPALRVPEGQGALSGRAAASGPNSPRSGASRR